MKRDAEQTACDQQAQGDRASSKDGISSLKILHLSDLHLGWRFEKSNWRQLLSATKDAKPDLVLVTGDLVNTPWFWMLKKARKALDQLSTELAIDAEPLRFSPERLALQEVNHVVSYSYYQRVMPL